MSSYHINYRVWSEEGSYLGIYDRFTNAFFEVEEFGGVVLDGNNDIVLSVPEDLKCSGTYIANIMMTPQYNWR